MASVCCKSVISLLLAASLGFCGVVCNGVDSIQSKTPSRNLLENGLGKTPAMGSDFKFPCGCCVDVDLEISFDQWIFLTVVM